MGSTKDQCHSNALESADLDLTGRTLNKVWIAEFDGLCSAEFLVLPCPQGLNNEFVGTRLNAEDFVEYANQQVSGERPRVDFEKLATFPIQLPPAAEQLRIVEALKSAFARLLRGESAAQRAEHRLTNYRAAVLDAAVTVSLPALGVRNRARVLISKRTGLSCCCGFSPSDNRAGNRMTRLPQMAASTQNVSADTAGRHHR